MTNKSPAPEARCARCGHPKERTHGPTGCGVIEQLSIFEYGSWYPPNSMNLPRIFLACPCSAVFPTPKSERGQ
jgi:hypothetical protein